LVADAGLLNKHTDLIANDISSLNDISWFKHDHAVSKKTILGESQLLRRDATAVALSPKH